MFVISLVVSFTMLKAEVLLNRKDVDVLSTINDRFFTPDDVINYEQNGFNIAAAFTAYDSSEEDILDPSYGELVFKHYYWGLQEDGIYRSGRQKINSTHTCSGKELGIENERNDSNFFTIREDDADILKIHQKKFKCID